MGIVGTIDQLFGRRYLSILMYHGVISEPLPLPDWCFIGVDTFRRQMRTLAGSGLEVLPIAEAVDRLRAGGLARPAVAITFDDGYRNNVTTALPVLQEFGFPATIFLTTGLVGTQRGLWPSRIVHALATTTEMSVEMDGRRFDLSTPSARHSASADLQAMIKERHGADPSSAVAAVEQALGRPVDPPFDAESPFAIASPNDLARAAETGLIDLGAHTVSHPLLSQLTDAALAFEIDGSIAAVTRLSGRPSRSFAYPNGRPEDFDDRAVERLRACGVDIAVTTSEGANTAGADPMRLRRWHVGPGLDGLRFLAKIRNADPRIALGA